MLLARAASIPAEDSETAKLLDENRAISRFFYTLQAAT